jgi:hypothetical protein
MSLGTTVLKGSIWTVSAAAANKIVTLLGQLALAWLLVPDDFGLAALALSFSTIATLFSAASFRTLLIQRREDFTKLSSDVFWLGLCVQVIGGLLIFFLAPFGAQWFGDERVASLIRIYRPFQWFTGQNSSLTYASELWRASNSGRDCFKLGALLSWPPWVLDPFRLSCLGSGSLFSRCWQCASQLAELP